MDVLIMFYGGKKYKYMSIVQNCTMLEGAICGRPFQAYFTQNPFGSVVKCEQKCFTAVGAARVSSSEHNDNNIHNPCPWGLHQLSFGRESEPS